MLTQQYSEQQRRAVNLVWTAAADYRFEPRFLALRTDGAPDFYMNCVIGYVHKWFGDDMPARLFASWAGDVRQAMLDDLAWLALENAAYERELPQRPALEELRAAHAAEFFSMEYQLSRQEWMNKNQLVYTLQSARWKGVLGERPPALNPWEKKLARALACPGTLSADELERAIRDAFRTYLQFDGTVHKKTPLRLHFDERWAPLLTKLLPTEIVRTDDLAIGRSAHAGQGGMVEAANALRATCARTSGRRRTAITSRAASAAASTARSSSPSSSSSTAPETTSAATCGSRAARSRSTGRGAPRRSILPSRRRSRRGSTAPPTPGTANSIRARCCA